MIGKMEEQLEIKRQFREQQQKFVYYVIALSVTSIGYSVYQTAGLPLNWSQIPLGFAILCWGFSIYCGFQHLKYIINTLYANNVYLDIVQGNHPEIGEDIEFIKAASSGVMDAMENNSDKANYFFSYQNNLFYLGVILFLAWHVIEMYNNTVI